MPVALLFTDRKNITQDYIDNLADTYDFFEDYEERYYYKLLKMKWLNNNGFYPIYCDLYEENAFFELYQALISEDIDNCDYFISHISDEPIKQREIEMITRGYKSEYKGMRTYSEEMLKYLETQFNMKKESGGEDDSIDIMYKIFKTIQGILAQHDLVDRLFKKENIINNKLIINEAENILNSDNK